MKGSLKLERLAEADDHLTLRNTASPDPWLWTLGSSPKTVWLGGMTIRYRFRSPLAEESVETELKIPGQIDGEEVVLRPGEELRIHLASRAPTRHEANGPGIRFELGLEEAPTGERGARRGDTLELFDPGGRSLESRMVVKLLSPVDWLNSLVWHSHTWLGEQVQRLWQHFQASGLLNRAAAMAYHTILVMVPFLCLLLLVFARLQERDVSKPLEEQIVRWVASGQNAAAKTTAQSKAATFLARLRGQQVELGSLMFVFGVISMALFLASIRDHLNEIRGSPRQSKPGWGPRIIDVLVFPGVVCLGYAAARLIVWGSKTHEVITKTVAGWFGSAEVVVSIGFEMLAFTGMWIALFAIYYLIPTARPEARQSLWAALWASVLICLGFFSLGPLGLSVKMQLFGPVMFIPIGLAACYMLWMVFFLGAFWAYRDRGNRPIEVVAESVHVRAGIVLAVRDKGSLELGAAAELLGVDPARVWSEALAIQQATPEGQSPLVCVGLCGRSGRPRLSCGLPVGKRPDGAELLRAVVGAPELLSDRPGCDPQLAGLREALLSHGWAEEPDER